VSRRVDVNQHAIVAALRSAGASVAILASLGGGIPDLLVGWRGVNFLLEVKADSKCRLTPDEARFHDTWRGQAAVICSIDDALHALFMIGGEDAGN
jgi:hypothetical protein